MKNEYYNRMEGVLTMTNKSVLDGLLMSRDLMLFDPWTGEDISIECLSTEDQKFVKLLEWLLSYVDNNCVNYTYTKQEAIAELERILPEWKEASKLNDLNDTTYQALKESYEILTCNKIV